MRTARDDHHRTKDQVASDLNALDLCIETMTTLRARTNRIARFIGTKRAVKLAEKQTEIEQEFHVLKKNKTVELGVKLREKKP